MKMSRLTGRVVVVSLVGCAVIAGVAYAATNVFASQESEAGTKTGNVATVSDTTASGSSAVKFGSSSQACPSSDTSHVPDGPDGMGGCWPGPLTTGPDVVPTEVHQPEPTGGSQQGSRYVFSAPVTIEGKLFNDDILVNGPDVVIKNSIINGTIEVYESGSLTIEDSEIHGGDAYWSTLGGYNIDLVRSEVTGGQQSLICNGGCDWIDTYAHAPHYFEDQSAHQSAYATTGVDPGYSMSVRHSTLACDVPQVSPLDGGCTGDLAIQTDFAEGHDITIDRNLFPVSVTGSYCVTLGDWPQKPFKNPSNIVFTNNILKKGANGKCGVYGSTDAWSPTAPGAVWSNNRFDDGSIVNPNT